MRLGSAFVAPLLLALSSTIPARAPDQSFFAEKVLPALSLRALGPANMGGRVVDVALVEGRPATMYVAAATGGLWKTVNNGTTWEAVFEPEESASLGAVAVAPSRPETVWVGTGEANPRNSASWGDGIYRSTDAGKTWKNMGLWASAHVGRIVIHPRDPDTVYVAALGRIWGPNRDRGLYKTVDGGKIWRQILFVNEDTGCIDVAIDPGEPDTLYAAAYQVRRDPFAGPNPAVQTGAGGGLYKSRDGGRSWTRLTRGLPDRPLGRCGVAVSRRDPRVVYAVVQTDKTPTTVIGQKAGTGGPVSTGGIFCSDDRGETWQKVNDLCPRPFYYGQIRVDSSDSRRVYVLGVTLFASEDGGKTFRTNVASTVHADHHALWIDPRDPDHLVMGGDGGLNFSYDRGATWEHVRQMPLGQFYGIAVDGRRPYRVYGGLQDNGSWVGPSATRSREGITHADWSRILGGDGFHCQTDPTDPNAVYAESQWGGVERINTRTGESVELTPRPPRGAAPYRFNWDTPILVSSHDPRTLYYGGNFLFRSRDRGDHWEAVSPDLTRGRPGRSRDFGHTLSAVAESPAQPGLLYAGSDDGRLHRSSDAGASWTELSDRLPGLPAGYAVACIECSRFHPGTAYLAVDRHTYDDRSAYLFATDDFGDTWRPLTNGLPARQPVYVVREDPRNGDLLFAGTEVGLFVSPDTGQSWHRLRNGFPTVPVRDLVVQSRDRELVIATHGRSLYVLDVLPLEEWSPTVAGAEAYLFDVRPALAFAYRGSHGQAGSKFFAAPNPPYGVQIYYYLREPVPGAVRLHVTDEQGREVAGLSGSSRAGLHRVIWDLERATGSGAGRSASPVGPGEYTLRLTAGRNFLWARIHVEAEK